MIVAGADVAGNTGTGGQSRFIAFILGTEESIDKLYNSIGLREIHMVDLDEKKKTQVFQNLEFTGKDIMAWCINVERQRIIDYISNHKKLHPKNKQKSKIHKHFDYLILQHIKSAIESFVYSKSQSLSGIPVQCDSDMSQTAINWKMKTKHKGKAYEIADAVAWCNEHDRNIKQCAELDLKQDLKIRMEHDLLK